MQATPPEDSRRSGAPQTLGDLLYADAAKRCAPEDEWVALIRCAAGADPRALRGLYERAHRPAFTSIMRLTQSRELAEELTVEVFCDLWRRAAQFDPSTESALGWIMNLARLRVLPRMQSANPEPRGQSPQQALTRLAAAERAAIEATFFAASTYVEAAARLQLPLATIQAQIHSGLDALCRALGAGREELEPRERTGPGCDHAELVSARALLALPPDELRLLDRHLSHCARCQRQREALRPIADGLACWPTDVLRPSSSLWERVAARIGEESGAGPFPPATYEWPEPEWEEVAAGISCKILAADAENRRVSMLVRLAQNASYPAHRHAGPEELHLLAGELWIDARKLFPGDYHYAAPETQDQRVWSETGCTCVLIASSADQLR